MLTGAGGTIGTPLNNYLQSVGYKTVCWDRAIVPVDDYEKMYDFIKTVKPEYFIHLAAITTFNDHERTNSYQVNVEWPSTLSWICKLLSVKYIFISSNLIFNHQGPYTLNSIPDAQTGYGYEKRMAEENIVKQNQGSVILRLGWQIGITGNNNMLSFLENEHQEKLHIAASPDWFPSCSFLEDTTQVITASINPNYALEK